MVPLENRKELAGTGSSLIIRNWNQFHLDPTKENRSTLLPGHLWILLPEHD